MPSRDVRAFVRRWVNDGPSRTVLLTTHYMVEADELCDRVAIINGGRLLACDTPAVLKRRLQREPIFHLETTPLDGVGLSIFTAVPGVRKATHQEGDGRASLELVLQREHVISGVLAAMEAHQIGLLNLTKREPTLEDVFVDLVGRSMADVEHVDEPAAS